MLCRAAYRESFPFIYTQSLFVLQWVNLFHDQNVLILKTFKMILIEFQILEYRHTKDTDKCFKMTFQTLNCICNVKKGQRPSLNCTCKYCMYPFIYFFATTVTIGHTIMCPHCIETWLAAELCLTRSIMQPHLSQSGKNCKLAAGTMKMAVTVGVP